MILAKERLTPQQKKENKDKRKKELKQLFDKVYLLSYPIPRYIKYVDAWKNLNCMYATTILNCPVGYLPLDQLLDQLSLEDLAKLKASSKIPIDDNYYFPNVYAPHWPQITVLEQAIDSLDYLQVSLVDAAKWASSQKSFLEYGKTLSPHTLRNINNRIYEDRQAWHKDPNNLKKVEIENKKKKERLEKQEQQLLDDIQERLDSSDKVITSKDLTDDIPVPNNKSQELLNKNIVFEPNEGPQTEFLAAPEREVLYGGAAGGGKSYGLLADPMRYFGHKQFNGLILRRTNDELRELVWKSQELYPLAYPGSKWQEKKSQWLFPSGARLWMTYLEREEDVLRYQGQAFSYIGFDELTQHATPFAWNYMRSRLRTTAPDLPIYMRATSNPGGPGHQWVKRMFIDPAPFNEAFPATDIDTGKVLSYPKTHAKSGEPLFYRKFIPATLKDNPYLFEEGSYEANLLSLPEMQKRQLLEGDWAIADGAAFKEFRHSVHVIPPFDIPYSWRKFRSCDFGYSSHSAVHWYAIDPQYETLYVYRELYVTQHTAKQLAEKILDLEEDDNVDYGILDSSCWHKRGQIGPSIAEEMISMGCRWRPSDRTNGARVAGRNRLHELLRVEEIEVETDEGDDSVLVEEIPGIIFFNTCRQIIADLPVIPTDPKGTDDIDPRFASDHAYDSIRYGIMSRPRSSSPFDDWGMYEKSAKDSWSPASRTFGY